MVISKLRLGIYAGAVAATFWTGWAINGWRHDSASLLIQQAGDKAAVVAAEAIAKIEVRNVTIRQQAETITREVPVYVECRHDTDMFRLLNDALTEPGSSDR